MDEPWLRDLLDRATAGEPPIGPLAVNALRTGIRRRRRRRAQSTVACVAAVALIGAAAVAATRAAGRPAAGPAKYTGPSTTYVLSGEGNLYAIPDATKVRSKRILLPGGRQYMAITPNGKTLYAVSSSTPFKGPSYVIPIATATNTPGQPSNLGEGGGAPAITPDGRILYLADYGAISGPYGVIPFRTATNRAGKMIKVDGFVYAIAVTPDGNTAYVASEPRQKPAATCTGQTGVVTPISTATNLLRRPIRVACDPYAIVVTPDGKTVWAGSQHWVTPISTATDRAGKPITFRGSLVAIVVGPTP